MIDKIFTLPAYILITISIFILVLLSVYSYFQGKSVYEGQLTCLGNPGVYQGKGLCIGNKLIFKKDTDEVHGTDDLQNLFTFIIDPDLIQIHEYYSFKGTITAEGKIKVSQYQLHPNMKFKYLFSSLSILIVFYFALKYIRIERNPLGLTIKNTWLS